MLTVAISLHNPAISFAYSIHWPLKEKACTSSYSYHTIEKFEIFTGEVQEDSNGPKNVWFEHYCMHKSYLQFSSKLLVHIAKGSSTSIFWTIYFRLEIKKITHRFEETLRSRIHVVQYTSPFINLTRWNAKEINLLVFNWRGTFKRCLHERSFSNLRNIPFEERLSQKNIKKTHTFRKEKNSVIRNSPLTWTL